MLSTVYVCEHIDMNTGKYRLDRLCQESTSNFVGSQVVYLDDTRQGDRIF